MQNPEYIISNKFKFALPSQQEAIKILTRKDAFSSAMNDADRQMRLKISEQISEEDFLQFIGKCVLHWDEEYQCKKLFTAFSSLKTLLFNLNPRLNIPDEILIIKTNGKEEANSPYTRQNAIVLPEKLITEITERELTLLIAHEFFHVMSRYNPNFSEKLYQLIGFNLIQNFSYPDDFPCYTMLNPDAHDRTAYIEIEYKGDNSTVIPILFLNRKIEKIAKTKEFLNYQLFKLLVIEKINNRWQVKRENNELLLLDLNEVNGFFEKISENTFYNFHPEELLAVNFTFLIEQKRDLPAPEILDKIQSILFARSIY
ncbi:hypothetical protein ACFL35_05755 [Candidatus Riflebacteria bacterium]